jgi:hypothetical protein
MDNETGEQIKTDVLRFLSYGWNNVLIKSIIQRKYGVIITSVEIRKIQDEG